MNLYKLIKSKTRYLKLKKIRQRDNNERQRIEKNSITILGKKKVKRDIGETGGEAYKNKKREKGK